jgi:hypothetical protein
MNQKNEVTEANLITAVRMDCLRQAKMAQAKLNEVIECLSDENHLGALGSFVGLDEDMTCLKVFLTRIARLTVGTASNRLDQSNRHGSEEGTQTL